MINKKYRPVSMDCTKEQFEMLKPHLEKIDGVVISGIFNFEMCPLLVNNYNGVDKTILNVVDVSKYNYNRTYIGAFNPKAFIEACGGEWLEEKPSMKGKWFRCIDQDPHGYFTNNKWYQCCKDSPLEFAAFIDNHSFENGFSEGNGKCFDLSKPMDFNPDTAPMAALKPETSFKEVPFNWETYLQYKDKGAYLDFRGIRAKDAHKFDAHKADYPLFVLLNGCINSFTDKGYYTTSSTEESRLKLFIPTTTKTITVWAIVNKNGDITNVTRYEDTAKSFLKEGNQLIELTKEIEI